MANTALRLKFVGTCTLTLTAPTNLKIHVYSKLYNDKYEHVTYLHIFGATLSSSKV